MGKEGDFFEELEKLCQGTDFSLHRLWQTRYKNPAKHWYVDLTRGEGSGWEEIFAYGRTPCEALHNVEQQMLKRNLVAAPEMGNDTDQLLEDIL